MQISLALSVSLFSVFLLCVQLHAQDEIHSSVLNVDNYVFEPVENDRNIYAFCSEQVSHQIELLATS